MRKYEFAAGIGQDDLSAAILRTLRELAPELKVFYLASCEKIKPEDRLEEHLGATRHFLMNDLMLDSAGWSVSNCTINVARKPSDEIANIYMRNHPAICISPDVPFYNVEFSREIWANSQRLTTFYRNFKKPEGTLVYDVVHGLVGTGEDGDGFTLDRWYEWVRQMSSVPGNCHDGLAVKVPIEQPEALAVAALFPASLGYRRCHILKAGSIEYMGVYLHVAATCYDLMTTDATNFTIQGAKNLVAFLPDENGTPITVELRKNQLERQAYKLADGCDCPICRHFEIEFGCSMIDLARDSAAQKSLDGNERLYLWIACHNVFVAQTYIEELRQLAGNRKALREDLDRRGLKDALLALDTVTGLHKAIKKDRFEEQALCDLRYMKGRAERYRTKEEQNA